MRLAIAAQLLLLTFGGAEKPPADEAWDLASESARPENSSPGEEGIESQMISIEEVKGVISAMIGHMHDSLANATKAHEEIEENNANLLHSLSQIEDDNSCASTQVQGFLHSLMRRLILEQKGQKNVMELAGYVSYLEYIWENSAPYLIGNATLIQEAIDLTNQNHKKTEHEAPSDPPVEEPPAPVPGKKGWR